MNAKQYEDRMVRDFILGIIIAMIVVGGAIWLATA